MVKLLSYTKDYMNVLSSAIAVCHNLEGSNNKVLQHVINSGHLSVLEHCSATFEIVVSRKVLAQITRHRHLSFTVQSSRACTLDTTYSFGNNLDYTLDVIMKMYNQAVTNGVPLDEASYLLPEGALCRVVVTGNYRTWLEMLPKRTCGRALKEFQDVANEIYNVLQQVSPEVFTEARRKGCKTCKETSCKF